MKFGLFGMNVTGGLVMTKNPQWKPSFEKIAQRLQMVERCLPDQDFSFVPISRWKGYSGQKEIAGDAIESICLASYLLSKTKSSKIFGSLSLILCISISIFLCFKSDKVLFITVKVFKPNKSNLTSPAFSDVYMSN